MQIPTLRTFEENAKKIKYKRVKFDPESLGSVRVDVALRHLITTMSKLHGYNNSRQYLADLVQQDVYANAYKIGGNQRAFDYIMELAEKVVDMHAKHAKQIQKDYVERMQEALHAKNKLAKKLRREKERAIRDVEIRVRRESGIGRNRMKQLLDEKYRGGEPKASVEK